MSHLISLENISLAYGLEPLLDKINFQINKGERVCLIGRNGAGKSSLLKIVEGVLPPDSGLVWRMPQLRMARLSQDLPQNLEQTVFEFVATGLAETGKLLTEYHAITHQLATDHSPALMSRLEKLQSQIDTVNGWQFENEINTVLTKLDLNPDKLLKELSGGWQRRAALAKALVLQPELLLLDEPTNHLDVEAIQWMEDYLLSCGIALLFITHDRALLRRIATRIIELDRGNLTSWPGDYDNFLRRKEELLHAEAKQNADFDKKLAQEEVWIRQGIKARRTRNEGRVRALEALRETRAKRREVQGKATFNVNVGDKSGQLVMETENVTHHFGDKTIIKNFSTRIMRGDRVGLIGPNGSGKSTLLNILLGNLIPESGKVTQGTRLQVAYFDQLRQALDPNKTVIDNVAEGSEIIEINGSRKHIISYLGDFLFTPQRAMTPVKALSGGECNRLLLARLFTQPTNLLVMDEPTNDLDIETLELLEELLAQYQGTLLLVSHDRMFLDNVVTSTLVFGENGHIEEYIGGYQDWLAQRKKMETSSVAKKTIVSQAPSSETPVKTSKKLSFKEQRELEQLPGQIEQLEQQLQQLQAETSSADFYKKSPEDIAKTMENLRLMQIALEEKYQRWESLDQSS